MTHHLPVAEVLRTTGRASAAPLHGVLSPALPPALTVSSGDEVILDTLDAWWGLGDGDRDRAGAADHPHAALGHALTGPIAVRGLRPGDTLAIDLLELVPSAEGFTLCGGVDSPHYRPFGCHTGRPVMLRWEISAGVARTRLSTGRAVCVPVAAFPGFVGLAPAAPGVHPTTPPRATGGNLDCRLLTAGSRLLLPVEVDGGLLSVGDGHAAQGDGEVSNNGIECALPRVRLRLTRRPMPVPIGRPVVVRDDLIAVVGLGSTVDAAAHDATVHLIDLVTAGVGCSRPDALGLASVAADLAVTQRVNGTVGVHAVLRRERIDLPELWSGLR